MEEQTSKTMKAVFTVVERQGKSYWTRVGVGFVNRDGSITLRLDAIPINGQLQVREWESFDRRSDADTARRGQDPADTQVRPRAKPRDPMGESLL